MGIQSNTSSKPDDTSATMSDPTNLSPHSDLRGPDLDFKRSRDHVSKWKYGWTEQNTGTKCGYAYGWDPQPDKDERDGKNIVPRAIPKCAASPFSSSSPHSPLSACKCGKVDGQEQQLTNYQGDTPRPQQQQGKDHQ